MPMDAMRKQSKQPGDIAQAFMSPFMACSKISSMYASDNGPVPICNR